MNWYNYVGGDPVNGRDPSGLCGQPGEPPCDDIPDIIAVGTRFR